MKAKLIKLEDGYELFTQGFLKGSTNHELIDSLNVEEGNIRYKLSLKNCQAIERGYDVYDLAKENYHKFWSVVDESEMLNHTFGYVEGFQKALEILGDKKFTEEDVKKIIHWSILDEDIRLSEEELFQSLQQTEWEVEVEMEQITLTFGANQFITELKPKLDAYGCLILKRVV